MHTHPRFDACLPLFPTPVLQTHLPDAATLNADLTPLLLSLRRNQEGILATNVGGWHSPKSLTQQPAPSVGTFLSHCREALSRWAALTFALDVVPESANWQVELWANVNRCGHYNRAHDHFRSGVVASGFYYVQCGGVQAGGQTVFINQVSVPAHVRCGARWRDAEHTITPTDGTLVVFPSWLGHRVEPYSGDGDRITLALNAGHPELPVRRHGDRPLPSWIKRLLRSIR